MKVMLLLVEIVLYTNSVAYTQQFVLPDKGRLLPRLTAFDEYYLLLLSTKMISSPTSL